uniref:Uncharacterized protein n=1 Tax=Opuntia streptacantha TaxID=393608 RepID=A0A7C9EJU6_OPUST
MPEEIRWYIIPKENKNGKVNIFRTGRIYNTVGHACVLVKKELEDYMDYDVGSYCKDDWNLAQKLMLQGCDPFPRRRCLTIALEHYLKPYPINVIGVTQTASNALRWRRKNSNGSIRAHFHPFQLIFLSKMCWLPSQGR